MVAIKLIFEVIKLGFEVGSKIAEYVKDIDELDKNSNEPPGTRKIVNGKSYQGMYLTKIGPDGFGTLMYSSGSK